MKAFRYHGIGKASLDDIEIPKARKDWTLVKVLYTGLCGTDLHIIESGHPAITENIIPLILGHEIVGKREDNDEVVVLEPQIACHQCEWCLKGRYNVCDNSRHLGISIDGGFAEYVLAPNDLIYSVPRDVPIEWLALGEPLTVVLNALEVARVKSEESVLIIGDGPMGIICAALAKFSGASPVILSGKHEKRLKTAKELGADLTIDIKKDNLNSIVMEETKDRGVDVIFEMAGSRALQDAVELAAKLGRILIFSMSPPNPKPLNVNPIHFKELEVLTSLSGNHQWPKALEILKQKQINLDPVISKIFPLNEINEAIDYLKSNKSEVIKILINGD